jgi:hypothetical protein
VDWKFEVELDPNNMEASKEQDIGRVKAGTYTVGGATEVQFRPNGDSLTLINVQTNGGWKITKGDVRSDDNRIVAKPQTQGSSGFVRCSQKTVLTG